MLPAQLLPRPAQAVRRGIGGHAQAGVSSVLRAAVVLGEVGGGRSGAADRLLLPTCWGVGGGCWGWRSAIQVATSTRGPGKPVHGCTIGGPHSQAAALPAPNNRPRPTAPQPSLDVIEAEVRFAGPLDELVQPKVGQLGVGHAVAAVRQQHVFSLQVAVDDLCRGGDGGGWMGGRVRCLRMQAAWHMQSAGRSQASAHHGVELVQVGQPFRHLVSPAHSILHQ